MRMQRKFDNEEFHDSYCWPNVLIKWMEKKFRITFYRKSIREQNTGEILE